MSNEATFAKPVVSTQDGRRWVAFCRLRVGQPHERGEHRSHEPFVGPYAPGPGCIFCGHANRCQPLAS